MNITKDTELMQKCLEDLRLEHPSLAPDVEVS